MLSRALKAGWTNLRRNPYLSFAATAIIAITLILFLGLLSFRYMTDEVVGAIESKVDISAYFKLEAEEEDILDLKEELEELPEIASVDYISREQALEDFKERHKGNIVIEESLELFGGNPLRASINIQAHDPSFYESISDFIQGSEQYSQIAELTFLENEEVISRIQRFSDALNLWGLITIGVIGIIGILVTFNTIRLTIYSQRQEIEIMRLVGASNWQIRGPYLFEGAYYGIFAALISLAVFTPLAYFISERISQFASGVSIYQYMLLFWWQILLSCLLAGILLGVISSLIAIRRHLSI